MTNRAPGGPTTKRPRETQGEDATALDTRPKPMQFFGAIDHAIYEIVAGSHRQDR
jgi:hypothetical protein